MQPLLVSLAAQTRIALRDGASAQEQEIKFADCPAAVRVLHAESKGADRDRHQGERRRRPVRLLGRSQVDGRPYAIGVLEDGTLSEMNLAVDDEEVDLDRCPAAVQTTLRNESFGEKITAVGKDMKYGMTIFETAVEHKGKSYEIVVAEDGTLVEKVLIIVDEEVTLDQCPAAVKITLREYAKGGTIGDITRSSGIGRHTFEAEVKAKDSIYLIEVAENGHLISKSLEAAEE